MPATDRSGLARIACHAGCRTDLDRREHHDRLLVVETDPDAMLELFDLAVTWHELEYSDAELISPQRWMDYAERHRWDDPERVTRIFALATDIAMRARPAALVTGSEARPTHLTVAQG